jgi:hypothetical protein
VSIWASLTIVPKVNDKTKVNKVDRLKELSIPFLNVMSRQMMMGGDETSVTEKWLAETVETSVEAITGMTRITDR